MKTTIDLPDTLFERTKVAAAHRRTTFKQLVIRGLETVLREENGPGEAMDAVRRLRQGYALGGSPLSREESHGR